MKEIMRAHADTRMLIKDHIENNGLKKGYIAEQMGLSIGHFSKIINQERELSKSNLEKLNEILNTDFELQKYSGPENNPNV